MTTEQRLRKTLQELSAQLDTLACQLEPQSRINQRSLGNLRESLHALALRAQLAVDYKRKDKRHALRKNSSARGTVPAPPTNTVVSR